MIKPAFLEPDDRPTVVGKVFGAPLVVKGWTGLPLIEVIAWGILTWVAQHTHREWQFAKQVRAGALASMIMLGSEWCHNLAHAAVAGWIAKPADAIRIFWGTPLLIYYDINDQAVTSGQHRLRALGGPLFSGLVAPFAWLAYKMTRPGSLSHYLAGFALGANSFIACGSLLPIPGLDGGVILKWSLVEKGCTPREADEEVQAVNRWVGAGLAAASGIAFKRRKKWIAAGLVLFAATSLAIGFGMLKEHE
jgi:Zn-dependent protease